jgi:hypothetical protein
MVSVFGATAALVGAPIMMLGMLMLTGADIREKKLKGDKAQSQ